MNQPIRLARPGQAELSILSGGIVTTKGSVLAGGLILIVFLKVSATFSFSIQFQAGEQSRKLPNMYSNCNK